MRAARFVADCLGLDFLNSADRSKKGELDRMGNGEQMLSWLDQARLVPPEVLRQMRPDTGDIALDQLASQARELREWLRGLLDEHAEGHLRRSPVATSSY